MPHLIPFGDRILVKRKTIGEKAGSIFLPDEIKERATDLAVVTHTPENTFADEEILKNTESIIIALTRESINGDPDALIALLRLNEFCKLKSIQIGDEVMISKYVGTDFHETGKQEYLTLVNLSDIIGVIMKDA